MKNNTKLLKVVLVIGCLVTAVCAGIFTRGSAVALYRYWSMSDWVQGSAQLTRVSVEHKQFKNHAQRTYYDKHKVHVSYHYTFEGKPLSGNRVSPVEKWGGEAVLQRAESLKASYRSDEAIGIYINPAMPSESAISKDFSIIEWLVLSAVAVTLWFLTYLTFRWFWRVK